MNPLTVLHPTLAYHLVNTLGWSELRPLQRDALKPVLRGDAALLLAPTAGGKTEAAAFPLLTKMAADGWTGLPLQGPDGDFHRPAGIHPGDPPRRLRPRGRGARGPGPLRDPIQLVQAGVVPPVNPAERLLA